MKLSVALFSTLLVSSAFAQSPGVHLKVAAVQFRSSSNVADNTTRIVQAIERLAAEGVNVAVFPECALTGYDKASVTATAEELLAGEERVRQTCAGHKIAAVVGTPYKVNGRTYNAAVIFNSAGELVERYAKVQLAGEAWATPGNHLAYFELEGVPSTVIVCHDERYPELIRLPAMQGARVVYYISHESGMKEEAKLVPYRAQMMARAVENQVFVVAANAPANPDLSGSHGQSRIIASDGNVLREASFFREETLIETLAIKPGRLQRPLERGPMAAWWREGLDWMMKNRNRKLE
jgi:predicted amidohydrolase